jgi:hypothetical protein
MFGWFRKPAAGTELPLKPQPVGVNQTPSERETRNKARLKRLHAALAVATTAERRASLAAELQRRATTGR